MQRVPLDDHIARSYDDFLRIDEEGDLPVQDEAVRNPIGTVIANSIGQSRLWVPGRRNCCHEASGLARRVRHAGRLDANRGSEWVIWRPVPDVSGVDDLVVCNEGLSLGVMCGDDAAQFALLRGDCVNRLSRFRAGRRTLSCDQTNSTGFSSWA